eukprot:108556-Hanusia_phi.AAC.1
MRLPQAMRLLLICSIGLRPVLAAFGQVPPDFYGPLAPLVVAEMQKVFVLQDGSAIQSATDGVVLQAVYDELLVLSPAFAALPSLADTRNASLFSDQELVRTVLLAVMGNFHSQTLQDADIYNDVQVVYDPVRQRFVTRQNMRDTEIVVFQVLLFLCVFGVFLLFVVRHDRPAEQAVHPPAPATTSSASARSMSTAFALPHWAQGNRLVHRTGGIAQL